VLVSGLITFIAAVHYFYMRDYWANFGESPTFFRYVDWVLTVPCLEFYLILKVAGAKQSLLWKMIILSNACYRLLG
jgi:bacteriorhodopsin